MRNLTERQAKNCEEAREPVCHCRCSGQFHGGKRGGANAPMSYYNSLPEDDPHFAPSKEQLAARRKTKQEAKRKERQEKIDAAWKVADEIRRNMYAAQRENNYELAATLSKQFLEAHRNYEVILKQK